MRPGDEIFLPGGETVNLRLKNKRTKDFCDRAFPSEPQRLFATPFAPSHVLSPALFRALTHELSPAFFRALSYALSQALPRALSYALSLRRYPARFSTRSLRLSCALRGFLSPPTFIPVGDCRQGTRNRASARANPVGRRNLGVNCSRNRCITFRLLQLLPATTDAFVLKFMSHFRELLTRSNTGIGCFLKRFSINAKKKCKKN